MRLLFYGSDKFSVVSLKAVISIVKSLKALTVVTKPNCPVHRCANENTVSSVLWPFKVPPERFDLGIVVSFGYLIPARCIENCTYGMVNVHPSLLPRWRGAAPLVHTLLNYDRRTGVSLLTLAKGRFDTGKIIAKRELAENPQEMEYSELHELTANVGAEMLVRFLHDVEGGLKTATCQSEDGVTKAPKVTPLMAVIDWERTAIEVDCLRRAVSTFEPLATYYQGTKLTLFLIPLKESPPDVDQLFLKEPLRPGYIFFHKKRRLIAVRCADGWIWIHSLSFKGRRKLTPDGFFSGYLSKGAHKFFTNAP